MTQNNKDRFGLKGDSEVQRARRLQLGIFPMPAWIGPVLALILAVFNTSLLVTAHHWPGWAGGALGILAALLGFLAWRTALKPLTEPPTLPGYGYAGWLVVSFIILTQARDLETRLNVGPLRTNDLIFPVVWVLLGCAYVWQTVQRNRRHPVP